MKIKVYTKELFYRGNFIVATFLTNLILLYYNKEELIFLLGKQQATNNPHFITTNLPEMLVCILKLCIYVDSYITLPIFIIQIWLFLTPAFYKYEHKIIKSLLLTSSLCYCLVSLIAYKVLIPYCWEFFSGFQLNQQEFAISIQLEARLHEYIKFINKIFITLNLVTIFCVILSFILTKFPFYVLTRLRKIIYFTSFIIATIITPPDIFSQILIGCYLIITYEAFLILIIVTRKYKRANNGTRTRNLQSHNLTL